MNLYELLLLGKSQLSTSITYEYFISYNIWYHATVCKQSILDILKKRNFKNSTEHWKYGCDYYETFIN